MKAYVAFVLVFLIISSLIAMDIAIASMSSRTGAFISQQGAFYSSLDANRRIEEAATVGSAGGISAYIAYLTTKATLEIIGSAGLLTPEAVIEAVKGSLDINEMKRWSNTGVVVALDVMKSKNEASPNGQGFYCTWATDEEINDAMNATLMEKTLYLPPQTLGLNLGNCYMIPQTSITPVSTDIDISEIGSGNLTGLGIEVSLYDEESAENGYRRGRIAHLYYDEENGIAGLVEFPSERAIKVLAVDESAIKDFTGSSYGWETVLKDRYNATINETILYQALFENQ